MDRRDLEFENDTPTPSMQEIWISEVNVGLRVQVRRWSSILEIKASGVYDTLDNNGRVDSDVETLQVMLMQG